MDQYKFPCEPHANSESIVAGPQYRFTIINDKVIRCEWSEDGVFEDRASTFAINRKFSKPEFLVEDKEDQLEISTPSWLLTYNKKRFSTNGLTVIFNSKQTEWGGEWHYGHEPQLNLGGTARTLDLVDGRCDMGSGVIAQAGYAALDDSKSMLFDGEGFVASREPGDRIDSYLFHYGYDYKGAMESFYAISGKQPVVPRWCLGNWWSRYHDYDEAEYLALMDKFKAHDIPLSVAVIDMDWHRVKGDDIPHVGWTGYSWNKALFPDPERFQKALHDRGLKITLNDHPHAGVHCHEDMYEDMAKVLRHDTTFRKPILFDGTDPKFMHAFLNVLHRKLEEQGCDFWWIDWQQGLDSRIPGLDPLWLLNHFQFLDAERNKPADSIIFSRYAGPGSHRYPVGFSGDTVASWASLEFQPEFTATASNIGYGWWSHDIGGHLPGERDDECTARWVQLGALSPLLRLHSTVNRWMSKEPWLYHSDSEAAIREIMQFRHRLVPYIYSMNVASTPLIQPLYWNFPAREVAYRFPNQYYFGSSLVVAPVVSPTNRMTRLAKTKVWVPPRRHVDISTGSVYDGDREIDLYRPLSRIPILAPEGSIIPLDAALVPVNGCANPDAFEVFVVVGQDGEFNIIEEGQDDREPQNQAESQRSISIKYDQAAGRLTTVSAGRDWTFRFISTRAVLSDIQVIVDGSAWNEPECSIETFPFISTVVKVPKISNKEAPIIIELSRDPQLAVVDNTQMISDLILGFQMSFKVKDRIWEALHNTQPTAVKMGRLLSLGLGETLLGPLAELILADSRSESGGCTVGKSDA
jgi:alpha-glucosidase (family GH31 glycosyl hydrolase)